MYRVGYSVAACLALAAVVALITAVAMGAIRLGTGDLPPGVEPPPGFGFGVHGEMSPSIALALKVAVTTGPAALVLSVVLAFTQTLRPR